jgi:hypothetical protein
MENIEMILGIIGTVSGIISILTLAYVLGYKFGRIETKLDFFDPKEFGKIIATVTILSKIYEEDIKKRIGKITIDILSEAGALSKNPTLKVRTINTDIIRRIGEVAGIKIEKMRIRTVSNNEKMREISLDELQPFSQVYVEVIANYNGRKVRLSTVYELDEDMNVNVISSYTQPIELKKEDMKNEISIEMMNELLTGYAEKINNFLATVFMVIIKITMNPESVKKLSAQ